MKEKRHPERRFARRGGFVAAVCVTAERRGLEPLGPQDDRVVMRHHA